MGKEAENPIVVIVLFLSILTIDWLAEAALDGRLPREQRLPGFDAPFFHPFMSPSTIPCL